MKVFKRSGSNKYWYAFMIDGNRYCGSTRLENKQAAEDWACAKRTQIIKGEVGIAEKVRLSVNELLDGVRREWELGEQLSPQNLSLMKQVRADFGTKLADEISSDDLQEYALRQRRAGYRNASINRRLELLRHSYYLKELAPPRFKKLDETDNVRKGFFSKDQMERLLSFLPDDGLRDFTRFAWCTGMRRGELASLKWNFIDGEELNVPAEFCKSNEPHKIPIKGPLVAIIERRRAARPFRWGGVTQLADYIFHRGDGLPILEFRKSWQTAAISADLGAMICPKCEAQGPKKYCRKCRVDTNYVGSHFHDLRRTAARDLVRLPGVSQKMARAITGHKTDSMFDRYNIVSTEDTSQALEKLAQIRLG